MDQFPGEWYYYFSFFNEMIFDSNFDRNFSEGKYEEKLLDSTILYEFLTYIDSNNWFDWRKGFIDQTAKERILKIIEYYKTNLEKIELIEKQVIKIYGDKETELTEAGDKKEREYRTNKLKTSQEKLERENFCNRYLNNLFYLRQAFIRGISPINRKKIYDSLACDHQVYKNLRNTEKSANKYIGDINFIYSILAFLHMFPRMLIGDEIINEKTSYVIMQNIKNQSVSKKVKLLSLKLIVLFNNISQQIKEKCEEILDEHKQLKK